jgi:nicotinate-nucleotide adenylyltransferase
MAIANYMVEFTDIEQLWFIISPQNPLKESSSLLPDYHRYELVSRAIGDDQRFRASNIEFKLPRPSYTIDTLIYLGEKYPEKQFMPIIGSDQMPVFHRWKNADILMKDYKFLVYPRPGSQDHELLKDPAFILVDAPNMEISSSFIRKAIRDGKDIGYYMPDAVWQYIREMHFYE